MKKEKPSTPYGPEHTIYYETFTDDVVQSSRQSYTLPDDYRWIRRGLLWHLWSKALFRLCQMVSLMWCPLFLHVRVKNRRVLRPYRRKGYFLYGNHTQPVGDVFIPLLACMPKRAYGVVSPANLGIPWLGKLLPAIGALPVATAKSRLTMLSAAIRQRVTEGSVVFIYPEAHVWPWYTGIRPFPATSFRYPIESGVPAFSMTTTYQSRGARRRPRLVTYIDGPFLPDVTLSLPEARRQLHEQVTAAMHSRSQLSGCEYIHYKKNT